MKNTLPIVAFSLLLAASVLLNGIHVRDVFNVASQPDNPQPTKVATDLHPHVDKQVHKISHDTPQLDGRSLRLRDYKRIQTVALRNWLNSWRDQLTLYFG